MLNLGGLSLVLPHWFAADAKQRELVYALRRRVEAVAAIEIGKTWLDGLTQRYGDPVALKPLQVLIGLPDYPKIPFWKRLLGFGRKMELVVGPGHLLFFDPQFSPDARLTAVAREDVRGVSINFGDGAYLYVKTRGGTIRCHTWEALEARPIADLILGCWARER